jgi:hypothetical protein
MNQQCLIVEIVKLVATITTTATIGWRKVVLCAKVHTFSTLRALKMPKTSLALAPQYASNYQKQKCK